MTHVHAELAPNLECVEEEGREDGCVCMGGGGVRAREYGASRGARKRGYERGRERWEGEVGEEGGSEEAR